jgi:hypothetical protein
MAVDHADEEFDEPTDGMLPPARRRLIVIGERRETPAHPEPLTRRGPDPRVLETGAIALLAASRLMPGPAGLVTGAAAQSFLVSFRAARHTAPAPRPRSQGGLDTQLVVLTPAEADRLRFPVGHPVPGTVYVLHPADPTLYYPMALFHRMLLEHKFSEAMHIVAVLGAAEVRVTAVERRSTDQAAEVGVQAARVAAARAGFERHRHRDGSLSYTANLAGRGASPDALDACVWLPHEGTWREVVRQRVEHGLTSFELEVAHEDAYAVTAKLAAEVKMLGLGVGGDYLEHEATRWLLSGVFPAESRGRFRRRRRGSA